MGVILRRIHQCRAFLCCSHRSNHSLQRGSEKEWRNELNPDILCARIHPDPKTKNLPQRKLPAQYEHNKNFDSSLFFTTLPKRRKVPKSKKKGPIPSGPLLISCKREEFNHFKGMQYGKFDVIPLASKGWHHRKSNGDYFTILPTSDHPAFVSSENVPLTFEEIGVSEELIAQLKSLNAPFPTTIQAKAIRTILEGNNTLIAAETGCGKTYAYLVPIVQNVLKWKKVVLELHNAPLAIIMLPTRELAMQVWKVANDLAKDLGLKCLVNVGINVTPRLLDPEMKYYDILVCTPGVLNRFMTHKLISTERCKHVVIDEADTLMDDSFCEGVKRFFKRSRLRYVGLQTDLLRCAQVCFVSATMPSDADSFLDEICPTGEVVKISTNYLHKIQPHIPQHFLRVSKLVKPETILKIARQNVAKKIPTMIFCNRTKTSNWLSLFLNENKVKAIRINAEMHPEERLIHFLEFKSGEVDVISCTDIASRGLDTTRVKHVINYDFPRFLADYIHRCGRTGRINHDSNCLITNIVSKMQEVPLVNEIEKAARMEGRFLKVKNNIKRMLRKKTLKLKEAKESKESKQLLVEEKQEVDEQIDDDKSVEKSQI